MLQWHQKLRTICLGAFLNKISICPLTSYWQKTRIIFTDSMISKLCFSFKIKSVEIFLLVMFCIISWPFIKCWKYTLNDIFILFKVSIFVLFYSLTKKQNGMTCFLLNFNSIKCLGMKSKFLNKFKKDKKEVRFFFIFIKRKLNKIVFRS